jgi:hypothetical protein
MRTAASRTWQRWHQLGRWVRPVHGDTTFVAAHRRRAAARRDKLTTSIPQAWPGGGAATVMRLLVLEQPAVVDVGDDLGAVGGGVVAVEAQHHRLGSGLELAVPA